MQVLDYHLAVNGVALIPKEQIHSLGVILDSHLLLDAQVSDVARSTFG